MAYIFKENGREGRIISPYLSISGIKFYPYPYIHPSPAYLRFLLSTFPLSFHFKVLLIDQGLQKEDQAWFLTLPLFAFWSYTPVYWKLSRGIHDQYGLIYLLFFLSCPSKIYQTISNNIILLINLKKCI